MLKSQFSIVNKMSLDKDFVSYDADEEHMFEVLFSGNQVLFIDGIFPEKIYGKLLICWSETVQPLFIILKDNKIHNLSDSSVTTLKYISDHSNIFKEFTNLDDILLFTKL